MMLPQVTSKIPLISSKLGTLAGGAELSLLADVVLVPPVLEAAGPELGWAELLAGAADPDVAGVLGGESVEPLPVGLDASVVLDADGFAIALSVFGSVSPHARLMTTHPVTVVILEQALESRREGIMAFTRRVPVVCWIQSARTRSAASRRRSR